MLAVRKTIAIKQFLIKMMNKHTHNFQKKIMKTFRFSRSSIIQHSHLNCRKALLFNGQELMATEKAQTDQLQKNKVIIFLVQSNQNRQGLIISQTQQLHRQLLLILGESDHNHSTPLQNRVSLVPKQHRDAFSLRLKAKVSFRRSLVLKQRLISSRRPRSSCIVILLLG